MADNQQIPDQQPPQATMASPNPTQGMMDYQPSYAQGPVAAQDQKSVDEFNSLMGNLKSFMGLTDAVATQESNKVIAKEQMKGFTDSIDIGTAKEPIFTPEQSAWYRESVLGNYATAKVSEANIAAQDELSKMTPDQLRTVDVNTWVKEKTKSVLGDVTDPYTQRLLAKPAQQFATGLADNLIAMVKKQAATDLLTAKQEAFKSTYSAAQTLWRTSVDSNPAAANNALGMLRGLDGVSDAKAVTTFLEDMVGASAIINDPLSPGYLTPEKYNQLVNTPMPALNGKSMMEVAGEQGADAPAKLREVYARIESKYTGALTAKNNLEMAQQKDSAEKYINTVLDALDSGQASYNDGIAAYSKALELDRTGTYARRILEKLKAIKGEESQSKALDEVIASGQGLDQTDATPEQATKVFNKTVAKNVLGATPEDALNQNFMVNPAGFTSKVLNVIDVQQAGNTKVDLASTFGSLRGLALTPFDPASKEVQPKVLAAQRVYEELTRNQRDKYGDVTASKIWNRDDIDFLETLTGMRVGGAVMNNTTFAEAKAGSSSAVRQEKAKLLVGDIDTAMKGGTLGFSASNVLAMADALHSTGRTKTYGNFFNGSTSEAQAWIKSDMVLAMKHAPMSALSSIDAYRSWYGSELPNRLITIPRTSDMAQDSYFDIPLSHLDSTQSFDVVPNVTKTVPVRGTTLDASQVWKVTTKPDPSRNEVLAFPTELDVKTAIVLMNKQLNIGDPDNGGNDTWSKSLGITTNGVVTSSLTPGPGRSISGNNWAVTVNPTDGTKLTVFKNGKEVSNIPLAYALNQVIAGKYVLDGSTLKQTIDTNKPIQTVAADAYKKGFNQVNEDLKAYNTKLAEPANAKASYGTNIQAAPILVNSGKEKGGVIPVNIGGANEPAPAIPRTNPKLDAKVSVGEPAGGWTPQAKSEAIAKVEEAYGMPKNLLRSIWMTESSGGKNTFNPQKVYTEDKRGENAQGDFGWLPSSARSRGVIPGNFKSELEGTAKYLIDLYKKKGSWDAAVHQYGGAVSPDKKTAYVNKLFQNGLAKG